MRPPRLLSQRFGENENQGISNALANAFAKALARPVRAEAVPRNQWESIFRAQGMQNPTPRIQMIDGFNSGWIDFPNHAANARKGSISIDQAIASVLQGNRSGLADQHSIE
jgi:hypothetical protein